MEQSKRAAFIRKFAEGSLSEADHEFFAEWVKNASQEELEHAWELFSAMKEAHTDHELPPTEFCAALERRLDLIDKPKRIFPIRWVAAATLIALAGLSVIYLMQTDKKSTTSPSPAIAEKEDFKPGSDKATLTLSDGRQISLDDSPQGNLAQDNGVSVRKNKEGQLVYSIAGGGGTTDASGKLNTISTPRGGQFQVNLPDGSKAWLNAASSLTFPVSFTKNERKVIVTGEAWFEIAQNKNKPFRVQAGAQELEVLGTQFNINSYEQGTIVTSLFQGSVKVSSTSLNDAVKLIPGEQSVLDVNEFSVGRFDLENVSAWRKGLFSYTNASLYTVMKDFERWYDAEVIYEGTMPNVNFTGQISRNIQASSFLEILSSYSIRFKLETIDNRQKLIISAM